MRKIYYFTSILALLVMLTSSSCTRSRGNNPGIEYMPDMANSEAYEPMSQLADEPNTVNPHGMNMRVPPQHTIAQGQLAYVYPYDKTMEGYEKAKAELKMPASIERNEQNLNKGKHYFDIYCSPCHGTEGLADGPVSAKLPSIPSYATDRIVNLPEGGMYHSITYGLNLMGSYASVLSPDERWYVIQYVQYLTKKANPSAPNTTSETTK